MAAAKDAGLRVDFSTEEASSEAFDFEAMPSGKYHCKITTITDKESTSDKNFGKPYWNVELTIQGGPHDLRKCWANVMLFEGALYSLAQLMKATGHADVLKTGKIPAKETLIGKDVLITLQKVRDTYKEERDGSEEPMWKNEVKGFKPFEEGALAVPSKGGSLLP